MLPNDKVLEVKRLLAAGELSQRGIAREARVSRATVGAIAAGRRPDYEARRLERASEEQPLGPLVRCETCGGMVYWPCRLCRLRARKDQQRQRLKELRRRARVAALRELLQAVAKASRCRDLLLRQQAKNPPTAAQRPTANIGTSRALPAEPTSPTGVRASATEARH